MYVYTYIDVYQTSGHSNSNYTLFWQSSDEMKCDQLLCVNARRLSYRMKVTNIFKQLHTLT